MSARAVITGIGLLSGHGEGADAHWTRLSDPGDAPIVDQERFAPYPVHPLGDVDFSTQITKKGDLRQMEPWQRIGTFTAGLALADAGLAGETELLDQTHMIVAAGSGERDTKTDMKVLHTISSREDADIQANEILPSNLRPTLFLAQLSNLLAGNISIVHKVTGSSRTFMGEEMAGVAAVEVAVRRIKAGQGELFLVGGAFNSERADALLNFELGGMLAQGPLKPVWERGNGDTAGFAPASIGAFLVIEDADHAAKRGARVYGEILDVVSGRCNRQDSCATKNAAEQFAAVSGMPENGPLPILSGASGAAPATGEELAFLQSLEEQGLKPLIRAYGSRLGHGVEAHFPAGLALAALSLHHGANLPAFDKSGIEQAATAAPDHIAVSAWGHWRGEALGLLKKYDAADKSAAGDA